MDGMAASDRHAGSVAEQLFAEAHRFDFYQAVALLELMEPRATPIGVGAEPAREAIRFESAIGMGFPPSDIVQVRDAAEAETRQPRMNVAFLGLGGFRGPLPHAVTEMVLERTARKDRAFRAFLDIFNHRLVSLMYRVRAASRVLLGFRAPDRTPMSRYLRALMGLGTPRLTDRMGVRDRSLLPYAGLLAGAVRSQSGLETLLKDYFRAPVKIRSLHGTWLRIEDDQQTEIGPRGRNNELGISAVLGGRVWDMQSGYLIDIGPISLREYLDFLPIGTRFRPLVSLARFYGGEHLDFDLRLTLRDTDIVQARLGAKDGSLLGWTSWLPPSGHTAGNVGSVCIRGRRQELETRPQDSEGAL